ncbi:hypothetical protein KC349_g5190 [Hortaea werneckii]|nr:hypothetical protein KC349_g5190 [Hortaea werneckii]
MAAKQRWRSSIRTPIQSRVFHASTPQITLPPEWFASRQASPIRRFPDNGFNLIDSTTKVEEEKWPWYSTEAFYPARIGELLKSRYQIIGKLGYGGQSTAWLCRDLRAHKYVVTKISETVDFSAERELLAYTRINSLESSHAGSSLLRKMLDTFEIGNGGQKHTCLIHEPLGMSLETCRFFFPDRKFPDILIKSILKHLLIALGFLHTEAEIVHTDLKAANVLISIPDEGILKDYENNQMTHPSARKTTGENVIYASREFGWDKEPAAYRAPEVTFNMPWDSSVDIWNLGVLCRHGIFEKELLFNTIPREDMAYHEIPRIVEELGMPPAEFIQRSNFPRLHFDDCMKGTSGRPAASLTPSPKRLIPSETAPEDFIAFMRKMLAWIPEERQKAEQLFGDAWLNS